MLIGGFSGTAISDPIDLSSWYAVALDLPNGHSNNGGNWVLSNNNETVTQTVNADPSFYLNNINQTNYEMDGSWKVKTYADNDFIGFVFGYQNSVNYYIFDWKQTQQGAYGVTAQEGFTVRKIEAANVSDLTNQDFWSSENTTHSTILATSYSDQSGWKTNTLYNFHLTFKPGEFSIIVKEADTELYNATITDATFTSGQFGFYNFSQEQVEYSGFEQTLVPVPGTIFLLGIGLLGLAANGRKKQH